MPVGHKDHGGIPVAVTVALGRVHEALDFGFRQVFSRPQGAGRRLGSTSQPDWGEFFYFSYFERNNNILDAAP
jgi:hypothetical protein